MENPGEQLLTAREIDTKIHRLAYEILERHPREKFVLVGLHKRGVPLAQRLAKVLEEERTGVGTGMLDVTLHRDDPRAATFSPDFGRTELPHDLAGTLVILVDDVLFTGRTIRAAISALFEYGWPGRIELAVLVDRGCRELPIQPDYCGLKRHIGPDSYLRVSLRELDGHDGLFIMPAKIGDHPPDAQA
jgi:pyrimidine operon attenuation protein/uracil phosphoribosyltransferase